MKSGKLLFVLIITVFFMTACAPKPAAETPIVVEPTAHSAATETISKPTAPAVDAAPLPMESYPSPIGESVLPEGYPAPIEVSGGTVPTVTYQNPAVGFQLDYPETWNVLDVASEVQATGNIYTVTLNSWIPEGSDHQGEGIPDGETKIDVTVFPNTASTLQEAKDYWRANLTQSSPDAQVVAEEEWTLAGELVVIRETVQGGMNDVVNVVTVINGSTVVISGLGDFAAFDNVARSLRAITP